MVSRKRTLNLEIKRTLITSVNRDSANSRMYAVGRSLMGPPQLNDSYYQVILYNRDNFLKIEVI